MRLDAKIKNQLGVTVSRNASDAVNKGFPAWMGQHEIDLTAGVQGPLMDITKLAGRDLETQGVRFTFDPHAGSRVAGAKADGRSIDMVPIGPDGKPDYTDAEGYAKIDAAMKAAADKGGVPVEQTGISGRYSLPKDYDVTKAPKPVAEPLQSRVDRVAKYVKDSGYEDKVPGITDQATRKTQSDYVNAQARVHQQLFEDRNTVETAVLDMKASSGQAVPIEQLMHNPDPNIADAWDRLNADTKRRIEEWAQRRPQRYTDNAEYERLVGLRLNNPQEFLEEDITHNSKLSDTVQREFIKEKAKIYAHPEEDPRFRHAMAILGRNTKFESIFEDKNLKNQFSGALAGQLNQYYHEHKKTMPDDEIQKVGANLILDTTHFWTRNTNVNHPAVYKTLPTADEIDALRTELGDKGKDMSDEGMLQLFHRRRYQELFGGSK